MGTLFDPYSSYENLNAIEHTLLSSGYSKSDAKEFYSWIFNLDSDEEACLIQSSDKSVDSKNHKPNPIGYCKTFKTDESGAFKIFFKDTFFETLSVLQESEFAILNGVTYYGRKNLSRNAGNLHALIFDIDVVSPDTVSAFFGGVTYDVYPEPSCIVLSGGGMHLYYIFEKPVKLYPETKIYVKALKYALTNVIWNKFTSLSGNIQQQGINQGFRVVGGKTEKYGSFRLQGYISNHRKVWTLEELASFVDKKELPQNTEVMRKESKCTLEQAKELYPQWYQEVIEEGKKKPKRDRAQFYYNRAVYDWWKRKIKKEAFVGNRYKCIMFLAVFASKCAWHEVRKKDKQGNVILTYWDGVKEEELIKDANYYQQMFTALGGTRFPFTVDEMNTALECFDPRYVTYPRRSIENFSGLSIPPNKRNGLTRAQNLEVARLRQKQKNERDGSSWRYVPPVLKDKVKQWRQEHPEGRKFECIRDTGISKGTVYHYWDEE